MRLLKEEEFGFLKFLAEEKEDRIIINYEEWGDNYDDPVIFPFIYQLLKNKMIVLESAYVDFENFFLDPFLITYSNFIKEKKITKAKILAEEGNFLSLNKLLYKENDFLEFSKNINEAYDGGDFGKDLYDSVKIVIDRKDLLKQYFKDYVKSFGTKEFLKKSKNEDLSNQKNGVYKIEIVKHIANTNKLKVILNENYSNVNEFKMGKYWSRLYELAENKRCVQDKSFFDYFNSHPDNPFYKRLGYKKTKILKYDGASIIKPNVELKIITLKKLNQRKNKLNKT